MQFLLSYLLFGPIVAIPLGITGMSWPEMMLQGMAMQLVTSTLVHFGLEALNYPALHKRALLEKFANIAEKEVGEIRHSTSRVESLFHAEFGHAGYYLSLTFFAFTLDVAWASVNAFALRLRTLYSAVFITIGSALAFGFWYWMVQASLSFVAKDAFFVLGIGASLLLLFYGQIHERHILRRIHERLHKPKSSPSS